jgi:hypothetical protein
MRRSRNAADNTPQTGYVFVSTKPMGGTLAVPHAAACLDGRKLCHGQGVRLRDAVSRSACVHNDH